MFWAIKNSHRCSLYSGISCAYIGEYLVCIYIVCLTTGANRPSVNQLPTGKQVNMTNICHLQRHTRRMCDATNDAHGWVISSHSLYILYIVFANCARFTARVQTDSVFIIEVWNITHQRAVKVANYLANNMQFALMLQRVALLFPRLVQPLATSIRPKAIWLPHMRKRKSMESERERERRKIKTNSSRLKSP